MIEIKFIFCLEWKVYVDSMCRGDLEEVCVIPFQYHKNVPAELDTWYRHDLVWNIVHSKSIWVALECSIDIHLDGDHICDQKKKKTLFLSVFAGQIIFTYCPVVAPPVGAA